MLLHLARHDCQRIAPPCNPQVEHCWPPGAFSEEELGDIAFTAFPVSRCMLAASLVQSQPPTWRPCLHIPWQLPHTSYAYARRLKGSSLTQMHAQCIKWHAQRLTI